MYVFFRYMILSLAFPTKNLTLKPEIKVYDSCLHFISNKLLIVFYTVAVGTRQFAF